MSDNHNIILICNFVIKYNITIASGHTRQNNTLYYIIRLYTLYYIHYIIILYFITVVVQTGSIEHKDEIILKIISLQCSIIWDLYNYLWFSSVWDIPTHRFASFCVLMIVFVSQIRDLDRVPLTDRAVGIISKS